MRGQTTLDFAIGMSLFLSVLVFVFLFVPGLVAPFTGGTQAETVTSNRVADQLSKSTLGGPDEPYVLDRFCTVEFFDGTGPGRCAFGDRSLSEQVGLDADRQNVNVTIRGNVTSQPTEREEILCWDVSDDRLLEQSKCDLDGVGTDDVRLARGDAPPSANDETETAQRVVSLDREDVTLYVEMW